MTETALQRWFGRSPFGMVVLDAHRRVVAVNQTLELMLGRPVSRLRGKPFSEIWSDAPGKEGVFEFLRPDGKKGVARVVQWTMNGGEGEIALVEEKSDAVAAQERAKHEAELSQTRALSSVLAHHVRNPLAGVSGALSILRQRIPFSPEDAEIVEEILERISELNESVEDVVIYGREFASSREVLSIASLAETCCEQFRSEGRWSDVHLQVGTQKDALIYGDADLLRQCMARIFRNAAEAMRGRGCIDLFWRVQAGGSTCALDIRDNGPGADTATCAAMLTPFFTTKSKHLGLGLSIVRRILQAAGGDVVCLTNDEGTGGLTVRLLLPAATPEQASVVG